MRRQEASIGIVDDGDYGRDLVSLMEDMDDGAISWGRKRKDCNAPGSEHLSLEAAKKNLSNRVTAQLGSTGKTCYRDDDGTTGVGRSIELGTTAPSELNHLSGKGNTGLGAFTRKKYSHHSMIHSQGILGFLLEITQLIYALDEHTSRVLIHHASSFLPIFLRPPIVASKRETAILADMPLSNLPG